MDRAAIYARLGDVFREVFDDDSLAPHDAMTARDVPAWDSLSNIRMVVAAEEAFGIQFSSAEATGLANVGEFVTVIQSKLAR